MIDVLLRKIMPGFYFKNREGQMRQPETKSSSQNLYCFISLSTSSMANKLEQVSDIHEISLPLNNDHFLAKQ